MGKLRTRILAGGAVAVFAGATAFAVTSSAGTATAAQTAALTTTTATAGTATAKASTALSIAARTPAIKAGRPDLVTGKLTRSGGSAVGRRVVELYRYDAKQRKWVPARAQLTRKGGAIRFIVRPAVTAKYELVYHGNAKLAAAHSAAVTVTVTK
jgi:hypothetical protein